MRAERYRAALLAALLAACSAAASAQEAPAEGIRPDEPSWRLSGEASFTGAAGWATEPLYGSDAALELTLKAGRPGVRAEFTGTADALTGPDGTAAAFSLERAYLRWSPGAFVVTLGRQVVNWGNALLWSPADLFAETRIVGLAPERAGTDALRVALPLGALGGVEALAVPAYDPAKGSYGGRLYGYALGSDLGLQAAWDGAAGSTTVAANIKTDLVVGLWAEAAYTGFDDGDTAGEMEAVIGADWSIGPKVIVSAEYCFKAALLDGALVDGGQEHHVYGSASAQAGDFISLGLMIVADAGEGILSGTASAVIDVAQDASLTAWIQYANGNLNTLAMADSALAGVSLSLAF